MRMFVFKKKYFYRWQWNSFNPHRLCTVYRASQKKLYTFEIAAKYNIYDSGGKSLHIWIAYELSFHMTPKSLKIFHAWMSTGHFCKGYEN